MGIGCIFITLNVQNFITRTTQLKSEIFEIQFLTCRANLIIFDYIQLGRTYQASIMTAPNICFLSCIAPTIWPTGIQRTAIWCQFWRRPLPFVGFPNFKNALCLKN